MWNITRIECITKPCFALFYCIKTKLTPTCKHPCEWNTPWHISLFPQYILHLFPIYYKHFQISSLCFSNIVFQLLLNFYTDAMSICFETVWPSYQYRIQTFLVINLYCGRLVVLLQEHPSQCGMEYGTNVLVWDNKSWLKYLKITDPNITLAQSKSEFHN